jgi:hypothetical protein
MQRDRSLRSLGFHPVCHTFRAGLAETVGGLLLALGFRQAGCGSDRNRMMLVAFLGRAHPKRLVRPEGRV